MNNINGVAGISKLNASNIIIDILYSLRLIILAFNCDRKVNFKSLSLLYISLIGMRACGLCRMQTWIENSIVFIKLWKCI